MNFYMSLAVIAMTLIGKGFRLPVCLSATSMIWATIVIYAAK